MGANGLCGKCSKERIDRVMESIAEKREQEKEPVTGQSGISDWV